MGDFLYRQGAAFLCGGGGVWGRGVGVGWRDGGEGVYFYVQGVKNCLHKYFFRLRYLSAEVAEPLFRGFVSEIGFSLVERLLWAWCGKKCPADSFFKPSIAAVRPQAAERRGRGRYCRLDRNELERAKSALLRARQDAVGSLLPEKLL